MTVRPVRRGPYPAPLRKATGYDVYYNIGDRRWVPAFAGTTTQLKARAST